jgi:hypothetical protein
MPRDHLRSLNPPPLSESELFQLNRLLDRRGQSLPEAQAARDKERAQERRLQEKRDKLAAEEARLSKRLAELHVDIDCVTAEIFKIAPSGVAFRYVAGKLQEFGKLAQSFSSFNTPADNLDRNQLMLFAEIGLAMFKASTRPAPGVPSLRQRMQNVSVDIGIDAPTQGGGDINESRAAMAAAIIAAGKKARGEM